MNDAKEEGALKYCAQLRCFYLLPCALHQDAFEYCSVLRCGAVIQKGSLFCASHSPLPVKPLAVMYYEEVVCVPHIERLPRGAALISYGGGNEFRSARNLLQLRVDSSRIPLSLRTAVSNALTAVNLKDLDAHVVELMSSAWRSGMSVQGIEWEATFALSSRVKGEQLFSPLSSAASSCPSSASSCPSSTSSTSSSSKINLYFHGYLFEQQSTQSSGLKFPLVGVFPPFYGFSPFPVQDAMGDSANVGWQRFQSAEQHFHGVDPWAGGTKENFRALLLESGMVEDEADMLIQVEEATAGDKYLGSDSARLLLEQQSVCSGWGVVVDTASERKRLLVTLIVVVDSALEQEFGRLDGEISSIETLLHILGNHAPETAVEVQKFLC